MNARILRHGLLLVTITICLTQKAVLPLYTIRSQAQDNARRLAGFVHQTTFFEKEDAIRGSMAFTPGYSRSFASNTISKKLFGPFLSCDTEEPFITISGSTVSNRGSHDLLADYFYLPTDFQSNVFFKPVVDNFFVDFQFHLELNAWLEGLYVFVDAPFVHSRWDLQSCEQVQDFGVAGYPAGYFTNEAVPRGLLFEQFRDYASGNAVLANETGTIFERLNFAKIRFSKIARSRFAAITFGLGYYCEQDDAYRVGILAYGVGPTGVRPAGEYLFEPFIGNGHNWEFGFGVEGQYFLWNSAHADCSASLYGEVTLSHLFSATQTRTFDLIGKPLSRYMLVEQLGTPILDGLQTDAGVPNAQFQNRYTPLANLSSLDVRVQAAIQADAVLALSLRKGPVTLDVGYNGWAKSSESITVSTFATTFTNNKTWALKGDSHVFGFVPTTTTAVALSASQNNATISHGTNTALPANSRNEGIDNPQGALDAPASPLVFAPLTANIPANQIATSFNPIFIKTTDLDIDGAQTKGFSNKFFVHIDHTWSGRRYCTPYLGFGGDVELIAGSSSQISTVSQWSIWLKGGITFE